MTDITKCSNTGCPIKEDCYRWNSEDSQRQSYSEFTYQNGKCDDFWLSWGTGGNGLKVVSSLSELLHFNKFFIANNGSLKELKSIRKPSIKLIKLIHQGKIFGKKQG